jgi:hypothetical protein
MGLLDVVADTNRGRRCADRPLRISRTIGRKVMSQGPIITIEAPGHGD